MCHSPMRTGGRFRAVRSSCKRTSPDLRRPESLLSQRYGRKRPESENPGELPPSSPTKCISFLDFTSVSPAPRCSSRTLQRQLLRISDPLDSRVKLQALEDRHQSCRGDSCFARPGPNSSREASDAVILPHSYQATAALLSSRICHRLTGSTALRLLLFAQPSGLDVRGLLITSRHVRRRNIRKLRQEAPQTSFLNLRLIRHFRLVGTMDCSTTQRSWTSTMRTFVCSTAITSPRAVSRQVSLNLLE